MGLSPPTSSACTCGEPTAVHPIKTPQVPDPRRYRLVRSSENGDWLIALVNYPDSSNYEGNKILVFHHVSLARLQALDFLDPHFCESAHITPRARFEPTRAGWKMAMCFVATMVHRESTGTTLDKGGNVG